MGHSGLALVTHSLIYSLGQITGSLFTVHLSLFCREAGGDTLLPPPRLDDNWQLLFDPHLWRVLHRVLELAQLGNVWRHQLHRVTGHTAGKE